MTVWRSNRLPPSPTVNYCEWLSDGVTDSLLHPLTLLTVNYCEWLSDGVTDSLLHPLTLLTVNYCEWLSDGVTDSLLHPLILLTVYHCRWLNLAMTDSLPHSVSRSVMCAGMFSCYTNTKIGAAIAAVSWGQLQRLLITRSRAGDTTESCRTPVFEVLRPPSKKITSKQQHF